jgi:hypothetical protein
MLGSSSTMRIFALDILFILRIAATGKDDKKEK